MLSRILVRDRPDWDRFQAMISAACESIEPAPGARIRAYGEMVDLLWSSGAYSAAIQLEEYWNRILERRNAILLCAYKIDVLGPEFEPASLHAILCDHTGVLPADEAGILERALAAAIRNVLSPFEQDLLARVQTDIPVQWCALPAAERMILGVRRNFPENAPEILELAYADYRAQISGLRC
jgi:hypothetical protein